ncbi:MAG: hypothetical protein FVQ83_02590 [Chloroflexi bacterium]|nr:hypothetical protein [Chloroflexota bacterium]
MRSKLKIKIPNIFLIFLIAGFLSAFIQNNADPLNTPGAEYIVTPNSTNGDQLNILAIIVEQVNVPQTRVLGIWLIAIPEVYSNVSFLPIYPSPIEDVIDDYSIPHEPIWMDSQDIVSATNLDILHNWNFSWDEVIIIDPFGAIEVLTMFGGAELYTQYLSGALSLNNFSTVWLDPQSVLHYQALLLESVCGNSQLYAEWLRIGQFRLPSREHFKTTFFDIDIFTLIQRLVSPVSNLQCNTQ